MLGCCRSGNAEVSVSHLKGYPSVEFRFQCGASGWPEALVRQCCMPALYCFGPISFSSHGSWLRLDAAGFLAQAPESTRAITTVVGDSGAEALSIEFPRGGDCWLSPPKILEAIRKHSWVGAPTDGARRSVVMKCIANIETVHQPRLGENPQKTRVRLELGVLSLQAVMRPGDERGCGRVRHVGSGVQVAMSDLLEMPAGLAVDVDFEIDSATGDQLFLTGEQSYELARVEIATWVGKLLQQVCCRQIQEKQRAAKAAAALALLEDRRKSLQTCRYVRYLNRDVFREPTNENQAVALFFKLEALGALPFYCTVLEYTPKPGIDAIGHFRMSSDAITEQFAPIEFEYEFQSFVTHGHPQGSTKLVVCWAADRGPTELLSPSEQPWLMYHTAKGARIPVVVMRHLPNIEIGSHHA